MKDCGCALTELLNYEVTSLTHVSSPLLRELQLELEVYPIFHYNIKTLAGISQVSANLRSAFIL